MKMKLKLLFIITSIAMFTSCSHEPKEISIIPKPQELKLGMGEFILDNSSSISFPKNDPEFIKAAEFFSEFYSRSTGNTLINVNDGAGIEFKFAENNDFGNEGYQLSVSPDKIIIESNSGNGAFYAVQSLIQIAGPEVFDSAGCSEWIIPAVKISDKPRFEYRGMHLDVCRHFFPVEFVKKYIDLLAFHKMNKFHWHLTEDQGWRIEIKKYPKLTEIGAYRDETMGDGKPYGGFYTQEEIKEVVKYAADRFITVIPEIEMPGHSVAALAAYPELACTQGPFKTETEWGIFPDIYCAGKEQTFQFLTDVLDEVIELFPSKYIHIGGDEAPKTRWEKCPDCQRRIKKEKLKNEHELQSYFITRIEKYLNSKGRELIGWDEILEGGLAPGATVMSWRGEKGGIEAAKQNHDVIMTPTNYCYFDYYQGRTDNEPLAIGGYVPLSKVYSYDPLPGELTTEQQQHILGAQGNVWTEYMNDSKHVEYMAIPRMAALAEVDWTNQNLRDFNDFAQRLHMQFERYSRMNVVYSPSLFFVDIKNEFKEDENGVLVTLSSELDSNSIYYTLDGSKVTENSNKYFKPFLVKNSSIIKARLISENLVGGKSEKKISINNAFNKNVEYITKFSPRYDLGNKVLVNGIRGSNVFYDGTWQGFYGNDCEVVVDLGNEQNISSINSSFIQRNISSIFMPEFVEYYISKDGTVFNKITRIENEIKKKNGDIVIKDFKSEFPQTSARYVKVLAKNSGICPDWHNRAGEDTWLFIDEIEVE